MHFDCRLSTYPLVWIQYISVRLSFHKRQPDRYEEEITLSYAFSRDKTKILQVCLVLKHINNLTSYHGANSWNTLKHISEV